MKAAPLACFLLLFFSVSGFGHGVERGSIWNGTNSSALDFLSDSTKEEISLVVEQHCDLKNAVSAMAEFAEQDEPLSAVAPRGFRIRIRVMLATTDLPSIIIVRALEKGPPSSGETKVLEYIVESPLCR